MARRELSRGSTGTARKIAEDVYSNHVEVRGEAEAMLRSIDAEETAQQCRRDRKTFDAAVSAYNVRNYAYSQRLIASIDARRLDPARLGHLREMMETPEMQPNRNPVEVAAVGGEGVGAKEATPSPQPAQDHGPDAAPGRARATDDPGVNLLKSTEAMRQIKFQQLRADGLDVQRRAQEKASAGQTEAAIDLLQQYLTTLDNETMDAGQLTLLRRPVESRLQKFKILKIEDEVGKSDVEATRRCWHRNTRGQDHRRAAQGREDGRADEAVQRGAEGRQVPRGLARRRDGPRAGPGQPVRHGRDDGRHVHEEQNRVRQDQGQQKRVLPGRDQ